jgi:hypothetical protein
MKKWIRKHMTNLAFAFYGAEKMTFAQSKDDASNGIGTVRDVNQGRLSNDLKQGRLTQQVIEFRARMYKILEVSGKLKTEIIGYDEHGMPITRTTKVNNSLELEKVILDTYDDYKLEMVVSNPESTVTISEIDDKTANSGSISNEEIQSQKNERLLEVIRELKPKFDIEKYTKKMNVRYINDNERLLEFYISMYPNDSDRSSRLFISEVKKAINNSRICDFLNINEINFVSHKTLGVNDFLGFKYKIKNFDKIISFDGHYVIKFIAEPIINGENILAKYESPELNKKYENKLIK